MKQLNEFRETELDELEEAWRTKHPNRLWNTNRDGAPPFSEVMTEEAKQHYIERGVHPDDLEWDWRKIPSEFLDESRLDPNEDGEDLDDETIEFMRETSGNPFWPESG